jgi:2-keto-3-deoxy-L-rhamnonate aldolase RhmA
MSKIEQLKEFLEQVKESDRIIEQEENRREELYKRIDEIVEIEGIDILSLSELV